MPPTDIPPRAETSLGPTAAEFWLDELEHRTDNPDAVRAVTLDLTAPPLPEPSDGRSPVVAGTMERLSTLDPLRDRPLLDDDPDAAVVVDILLTCLGLPTGDYSPVARRIELGERFWARATAREVLEGFLHGDSIYATPECRVRLEGRARYNLAFDLARLAD